MRMMLRRSGIAQPLARMWLYRGRVSDSLSRPPRRGREKPSKARRMMEPLADDQQSDGTSSDDADDA